MTRQQTNARAAAETVRSGRRMYVCRRASVFTTMIWQMAPGDFSADGVVDAAGQARWSAGFGIATGALLVQGNSDRDCDVDNADFLIWQRNFRRGWLGSRTLSDCLAEAGNGWLAHSARGATRNILANMASEKVALLW